MEKKNADYVTAYILLYKIVADITFFAIKIYIVLCV